MYIITKRSLAALALLAAAALTGGCGGGSTSTATPHAADGRVATIGLRADGGLGTILVDSNGRTLYLFRSDPPGRSVCVGACAAAWPPLRDSSAPVAGTGLEPSLVGFTRRADGHPQVTYNGHPLYLFRGDTSPGDTSGQGVNAFGGLWYALSDSGDPVTGSGPTLGASRGY
jgi:predicted lipoprotein with Yx(FWY)xxD motif